MSNVPVEINSRFWQALNPSFPAFALNDKLTLRDNPLPVLDGITKFRIQLVSHLLLLGGFLIFFFQVNDSIYHSTENSSSEIEVECIANIFFLIDDDWFLCFDKFITLLLFIFYTNKLNSKVINLMIKHQILSIFLHYK